MPKYYSTQPHWGETRVARLQALESDRVFRQCPCSGLGTGSMTVLCLHLWSGVSEPLLHACESLGVRQLWARA